MQQMLCVVCDRLFGVYSDRCDWCSVVCQHCEADTYEEMFLEEEAEVME